MSRMINEIIVHCTATDYMQNVSVEDINRWHKERGFAGIGYHYVVDLDGVIHPCRPVRIAGAHCKGHNAHSIGVCYVGGLVQGYPHDTRTDRQKRSLNSLIATLCCYYPVKSVVGHNKYSNKSCPCFDAEKEYSHLIKNIL